MSLIELTKVRDALAGALSIDEVHQLGRDTGQAVRLRTITPHRLFLAVVSALASARVDTIADVARFRDIVIQDGSSFALKAALHPTFPGRFTTMAPAAVEVHAT